MIGKTRYLAILFLVAFSGAHQLKAQYLSTLCGGRKGIRYQVTGSPGSIYHWKVRGGQIVSDTTGNTITVNWDTTSGIYPVQVVEQTLSGCLGNTMSGYVRLKPAPYLNLGPEVSFCTGSQVELNAGEKFSTYLWQDGSSGTSIRVSRPGVYWVEVSNTSGCTFRDTIILVMNPLPAVDLGRDTMLCGSDELTLNAGNDGTSYQWSTGAISPSIVVYAGEEMIKVKVTDVNGCSQSDSIHILKCPEAQMLTIPKAFTPGRGTKYNVFRIDGIEWYPRMRVRIYDRWGILLFESDSGYSDPWDGTSNGREMPMDAYFYVIHLGDGSKDLIGTVTLIR